MRAKIQQSDHGLTLEIPGTVAEQAGFAAGTEVEISADGQRMIAEAIGDRETLDDLLDGIRDHNRHAVIDWGDPVGRELDRLIEPPPNS